MGRVAETRYIDRDDAVITLSHARNLVEYGFVGVSPSGERIEGFSAPLQFFVAAAIPTQSGRSTITAFPLADAARTIALGAAFAALLVPTHVDAFRLVLAGAAVVLGGYILGNSTAFLWWHASGMENVYKSVALLALIGVFDGMLRAGRIWWGALPLITLAAITRIDAIVPVGILLATFTALWLARRRNPLALWFALAGLTPWLVFMAARGCHFGQWEPNTAAAQAISVGTRLAGAARGPLTALVDYRDWFSGVGASLFAFQLLWLIPLVWFARRQPAAIDRLTLICAGAIACIVAYAMFGPSRMDPPRTVTEPRCTRQWRRRSCSSGSRRSAHTPARRTAGLDLVGCCHVRGSAASSGRRLGRVRVRGDGGLPRADCRGARISQADDCQSGFRGGEWRKRFNMVDFGRLGSTVIPRVQAPGVLSPRWPHPTSSSCTRHGPASTRRCFERRRSFRTTSV